VTSLPALAAPHTDGVLAALAAATPAIPAGRGVKPSGGGWQGTPGASNFTGYVVVYPQAGAPEGTLGDRYRDLLYGFQITAVGATAQQAEIVADRARQVLLADPPTVAVTGRRVQPLWQILDQPAQRDDQLNPAEFYAVTQYRMRTEPSP
jgi:hypothetical protein